MASHSMKRSFFPAGMFVTIGLATMISINITGCAKAELQKKAQLLLPAKIARSQLPLEPSVRFAWDGNQPLTLKVYRDTTNARSEPVLIGQMHVYNDLGHEVNYAIGEEVIMTANTTIEVTGSRLSEQLRIETNTSPILTVGHYYATVTFEGATRGKAVLFTTEKTSFVIVD